MKSSIQRRILFACLFMGAAILAPGASVAESRDPAQPGAESTKLPPLSIPMSQLTNHVSCNLMNLKALDAYQYIQSHYASEGTSTPDSVYPASSAVQVPVIYYRDVPLSYVLSWTEYFYGVEFDLVSYHGRQVDRKAMRVLYKETRGEWVETLNTLLQEKATLHIQGEDLIRSLRALSIQTGFTFIVDPSVLTADGKGPPVRGKYPDMPVEDILEDLLKQTGVTYRLQGHALYFFRASVEDDEEDGALPDDNG